MATSNLFYFKVLGIQPDFTIDDIVAYFQTARCGSGIVHKVIYLDAKKTAVLIGVEGLTDRAIDKLFKGAHRIMGKSVSVRRAKPPTDKQRAQAVHIIEGQSADPTWTISQHIPSTKVPAQQQPLKQSTKPALSMSSHSATMHGSEHLASPGSNSGTTVPSQSALQQSSAQAAPLLSSPQIDSTPEHTQTSFPLLGTGRIDPSIYANMNTFEAAQLPPQFSVALPQVGPVQSSSLSRPSSLDVSTADARLPVQMNIVQSSTTLPPSHPMVDRSQIGSQGRNTRITATQLSFSQPPSGKWPTVHDEDHSSQSGYMAFQSSTAQQPGSQTIPQYGISTGPQQGGYSGLKPGDLAGTQLSGLHNRECTGNSGQSTLAIEEGFNSNLTQEWPTFAPEPEGPLPAATQPHSPPSDVGGAVVQVEGVEGLTKDYLELGFDDDDKGGGEIDEIDLKGNIALITFKDVKVAAKVASEGIWTLMGRTVKVSLYQPKPDPDPLQDILAQYTRENTLVLTELPASVGKAYLSLHIEMETRMSEDSFKFYRRGNTALMKLAENNAQDVFQMLSSSTRPLDKETKAMLKVEFLAPVQTIRIQGIQDEKCDEKLLKMYFQNKKKSGAGVNATVEVTGRGQATVSFEPKDLSVISGVLTHDHSKVLGPKVSVKLYHPILSHWFKENGTNDSRPQRAQSTQHKRFDVPVSTAIQHHLKRTDFMAPLNEKLNEACGNATLCEQGILVDPTSGSEWNRQWATQCKEIIDSFLGTITELPLDVPAGVMDKVSPVIWAQLHNPNVTITPSGSGDQVVMIGRTSDVGMLESKVRKIIHENLDTVKNENFPTPVLVLIDQCVGQRLKGVHKNVLFETDLCNKTLQVSGKDLSCDKFLEEVRTLHSELIDVRLGEEAVGLLASATGKPLLLSKIGEQAVGHYFSNAEGELPSSDVAVVTRLHLVAENRRVAVKVAQNLQNSIATTSIDVPEELKYTVHSEAWSATRRRIQSNFGAVLNLQPENSKIVIVCDSRHVEKIKVELKQFVQGECYEDSTIEIERLQWEFMETYSKGWKELSEQIKGSGLQYSFPDASGSAVIKMKGEVTPVSKFTRCIHEVRDGVKVGKKEVSMPGAVKHFESTVGKNALKGIAASQKAVVDVYTVEEEADNVNRATRSLHHKICHGTTDDGRLVNIVQGDLTDFSADVIVNAANEQLNHTGGIAGIIARKGGSIVQEESTKHVERAGRVSMGDAVLLKAVGNLPCKAIVHAIGPRWNGGHAHEEAYLAKAVRNSLAEASKHNYTSIAFPAISSGIFGVPVDICARAMMQGIKEFSAMGQSPVLHVITIVLLQGDLISSFTKTASRALKNYSDQPGGHTETPLYPSAQRQLSSTGPRRPSGIPVAQGLELKKGSLTSYQADVYVNTAHNQLDLKHGAVSHSLLKAGGSALQDECDLVVATRGTIPYWDIATTSGGNLQCQHIIHTVGANYKGMGCKKNLESMITKVMQECDRLNATSVAFPAIGTGNLGFPEDAVAEVMVRTISSYLRQNPSTTVKTVLLVIFMESTHRAFQLLMPRIPSVPPSASFQAETHAELLSENLGATSVPRPLEGVPGSSELLRSFTCNGVNVDIVNGDISADDSEGIVNTASDNLQLRNFGVMGALLRRGGQELQDDCSAALARYGKLDYSKVIVTGPGRPGGLKCRKVIHVLAPASPGGLVKTVKACLNQADSEGLKSVALPAIGTGQHGFTPAEAAAAIAEGIVQFCKSSHNHVSHIKVVLYQKELFDSFSVGFAEAGNTKGLVRRALDIVGGAWNSVKALFEPSPKPPPMPVLYSGSTPFVEGRVLCIKAYAESQAAIDTIFREVEKAIDETIQEACIKDVRVDKLGLEAVASLERHAAALQVKITVDRSPLNQVCLKGNKADVARMTNEVREQLHTIERQENREKEADLLTSKFQWQWKDDNGEFQNYQAMTNLEIEEAYGKREQSVTIHTEVGPRIIDFNLLHESDVRPPFSSTIVKRRDFEQERKEREHPSYWDPMPKDPGTGKEVECHVVKLSSRSKEYKDVAAQFNRTMGSGVKPLVAPLTLGTVGVGGAYQGRIQKIERIQNTKLYAQYIARKKVMDKANAGHWHQNERQLFHGCSFDVVDAINHGGFNRSYSGLHASHFGRGSYFARDASYSANARYSAPDLNGHQHMYLARVLTGEYTTGQSGYLVPPAKDPNNPAVLYDSVVDNVQNPKIFVIFYDPQAYPEYHIEFC